MRFSHVSWFMNNVVGPVKKKKAKRAKLLRQTCYSRVFHKLAGS